MKNWSGGIIWGMESFNQNNQNENKETGWEIAAEDQRAVIEAQIQMPEAQRLKLEDQMRAYDSKFYEIDVQINGLEFQLKNIKNNN